MILLLSYVCYGLEVELLSCLVTLLDVSQVSFVHGDSSRQHTCFTLLLLRDLSPRDQISAQILHLHTRVFHCKRDTGDIDRFQSGSECLDLIGYAKLYGS